ncbi:hypothetical protein BH11PSE12_BH11PSE12_00490 [soil metagenome]
MITHSSESLWLTDTGYCQLEHLVEVSGLSREDIEDLITNDVIVPEKSATDTLLFQLRYVVTVKTARRLRDDFQLDRHGLSLALTLLERIHGLESELQNLHAKLRR